MIVVTCLLFLLRWVALLGSAAIVFVRVGCLIGGFYYIEKNRSMIFITVVSLATVIVLGASTITTGF